MPKVIIPEGTKYVLFPSVLMVEGTKGTHFTWRADEYKSIEEAAHVVGRGLARMANDSVSDSKVTGDEAQKIVGAQPARWVRDPEGKSRGPIVDETLRELRILAVDAGFVKVTDARISTMEGLKVLFGEKWDEAQAHVAEILARKEASRAFAKSLAPTIKIEDGNDSAPDPKAEKPAEKPAARASGRTK